MIVTFEEIYLKELFEKGKCSDKKHRYQPEVVKRYRKRVETLMAIPKPESLYAFNSLHFEALRGDKSGRCSIRVNDQYRIEFILSEDELTICNIVELSNHYK